MDFTQPKLKVHLMGPRHLCPTYWTRRFQCLSGRDPFNQNCRKFPSKTQWIGSVQPEKFRRNGPPFKVDQFSRSDRLEFWLNGSRPLFYFFLPFYLAILSVSSDTCKLKESYSVFSSYSVIIVDLSSSFCCFSLNSWDSMSFHFISSDQSSFLLSRPSYL